MHYSFINLSLKVYTFLANGVASINLCLYLGVCFRSWVLWEYYSPMIWTLTTLRMRPSSLHWLHDVRSSDHYTKQRESSAPIFISYIMYTQILKLYLCLFLNFFVDVNHEGNNLHIYFLSIKQSLISRSFEWNSLNLDDTFDFEL